MPRTSRIKSTVPVRRKKPASKTEAIVTSSLPATGNLSVTVNVIWPSEAGAASNGLSSLVGPWVGKTIHYCIGKLWMFFRS